MSSVTIAAAAAQILSNTLSALNAVRERAKSSKDTDLKDHISTLYDNVLSLKEAVMRLTEENGEHEPPRIVRLTTYKRKSAWLQGVNNSQNAAFLWKTSVRLSVASRWNCRNSSASIW
jgi:hypothetical protein